MAQISRNVKIGLPFSYYSIPFSDYFFLRSHLKSRRPFSSAAPYLIINGSDGKLRPQDFATRAQISAIPMRYFEK